MLGLSTIFKSRQSPNVRLSLIFGLQIRTAKWLQKRRAPPVTQRLTFILLPGTRNSKRAVNTPSSSTDFMRHQGQVCNTDSLCDFGALSGITDLRRRGHPSCGIDMISNLSRGLHGVFIAPTSHEAAHMRLRCRGAVQAVLVRLRF